MNMFLHGFVGIFNKRRSQKFGVVFRANDHRLHSQVVRQFLKDRVSGHKIGLA